MQLSQLLRVALIWSTWLVIALRSISELAIEAYEGAMAVVCNAGVLRYGDEVCWRLPQRGKSRRLEKAGKICVRLR